MLDFGVKIVLILCIVRVYGRHGMGDEGLPEC